MKVEIYGKDNCPNCDTAVAISEGNVEELHVYKMGKDFQIPDMMTRIGKRVAAFPQIFVNNEYVGSLKEYQDFLTTNDSSTEDLEDLGDLDL